VTAPFSTRVRFVVRAALQFGLMLALLRAATANFTG
jgi:hypothetical protein